MRAKGRKAPKGQAANKSKRNTDDIKQSKAKCLKDDIVFAVEVGGKGGAEAAETRGEQDEQAAAAGITTMEVIVWRVWIWRGEEVAGDERQTAWR